jgi:hypothetical protein
MDAGSWGDSEGCRMGGSCVSKCALPCALCEKTGCMGNDGLSRDGSRGMRGAKYVLWRGSAAVDDEVDCCVETVDSDVSDGGAKGLIADSDGRG